MSSRTLLLLLVVVLSGHSLFNGLLNGFHYDDGHSLLENPHIRTLANIPHFFTDPTQFSEDPGRAMYRPLVLLVHAVNFAFFEYEPQTWYHSTDHFFFLFDWPKLSTNEKTVRLDLSETVFLEPGI